MIKFSKPIIREDLDQFRNEEGEPYPSPRPNPPFRIPSSLRIRVPYHASRTSRVWRKTQILSLNAMSLREFMDVCQGKHQLCLLYRTSFPSKSAADNNNNNVISSDLRG